MIDFNGNGRIDPADIGVFLALSEQKKPQKPHSGCAGACLMIFLVLALAFLLLFR